MYFNKSRIIKFQPKVIKDFCKGLNCTIIIPFKLFLGNLQKKNL